MNETSMQAESVASLDRLARLSRAMEIVTVVGMAFIAGATATPTGALPPNVKFGGKFVPPDWAWYVAAGILVLGLVVGGVLLDHLGAGSLAWAVLVPTLLALVLASRASRHAFKPGPRAFD